MIEIVIYLKHMAKIHNKVATNSNARAFARNTILYGAFETEIDDDGRHHEVFWPPSAIEKIKILDVPQIDDKSSLKTL